MKKLYRILQNIVEGLWNNYGIFGNIIVVIFVPIALVGLGILWTLKFGFNVFRLLLDEVNYNWRRWSEGTSMLNSVFGEFIYKKIYSIIQFLWLRLFDDNFKFNREINKMEGDWKNKCKKGFLLQLNFFWGLIIILLTFSSFIYSLFKGTNHQNINYLLWALLRVLLLTPLAVRYFRFRHNNRKFSWDTDETDEGIRNISLGRYIQVVIITIFLILIVYLYKIGILNYFIAMILNRESNVLHPSDNAISSLSNYGYILLLILCLALFTYLIASEIGSYLKKKDEQATFEVLLREFTNIVGKDGKPPYEKSSYSKGEILTYIVFSNLSIPDLVFLNSILSEVAHTDLDYLSQFRVRLNTNEFENFVRLNSETNLSIVFENSSISQTKELLKVFLGR